MLGIKREVNLNTKSSVQKTNNDACHEHDTHILGTSVTYRFFNSPDGFESRKNLGDFTRSLPDYRSHRGLVLLQSIYENVQHLLFCAVPVPFEQIIEGYTPWTITPHEWAQCHSPCPNRHRGFKGFRRGQRIFSSRPRLLVDRDANHYRSVLTGRAFRIVRDSAPVIPTHETARRNTPATHSMSGYLLGVFPRP